MRTVTSVATMQRLARLWTQGATPVALVPTMGCLHAGHLKLIERARKLVGRRAIVVVSLYVNPLQFGPAEDFSRYPRDLARDKMLSRQAGVDVMFVPDSDQMYSRSKVHSTYVIEEKLSQVMEGRSRPTHFRGVTTVVAKLFNIVQPQVAVFGAKDFQQAAIVQRMVHDLNFPVKIVIEPTVREGDGLALSSRNKYLEGELRTQARSLWQALQRARAAVRASRRPLSAAGLKKELRLFIETHPAARVDYIEFFKPGALTPVLDVARGTHMALAVFIGKTRLIDNGRL